jgi:hypothetical protein
MSLRTPAFKWDKDDILSTCSAARVPMSTDWHWLDRLTLADLDSDFMEAVAERVEDTSARGYRSTSTEAARGRRWNRRKQAGGAVNNVTSGEGS